MAFWQSSNTCAWKATVKMRGKKATAVIIMVIITAAAI